MKLCCVLVFLLAGAASGAIEKRILGAKACNKDRQYHVQIKSVQKGKICGGALLNTRWVITASHCAEQEVSLKLGSNNDVSFLTKAFSFIKGNSKKYEQKIPVAQQFTYKPDEGKPHDIMLIKLNEDMSGSLPVIGLPSGECKRPEVKEKVQIGGMGATKKGAKSGKELRCAMTQISECAETDQPGPSYEKGDSLMCANTPGVETCYGDAGTAVEYDGHLHGIIVSEPLDKCVNPIIMLDICPYMEWIDKTMKENA